MKWLHTIALASALTLGLAGAAVAAITVLVPTGPDGAGLRSAAADYQAATGKSVEVVQVPFLNVFEKAALSCSARSGSFDILLIDDPWFQFLADNECLEPLGDYFRAAGTDGPDNDFVGKSLALCRNPYNTGPFFCLPYVGNAQFFFYNSEMLEEAGFNGAMDNWASIRKGVAMVSEKGNRRKHGWVCRCAQGNIAMAQFLPVFWSFGGTVLDENGQPNFQTQAGRDSLELFMELAENAPPGVESFGAEELISSMVQGRAAVSIFWPIFVPQFEDPEISKVVGKISFTPMPSGTGVGKSMIGHWLLAITADSANKQEAFDFITWATSPEQIKVSVLRGNSPVRVSAFQDPELTSKSEFRYLPVLLDAIRNSQPRPRHVAWPEMALAIGNNVNKALSGNATLEEALAAIDKGIAQAIK